MKKTFNDILNGIDRDMEARAAAKLPDWTAKGLEYPSRICLEQCSSSVLAARKAEIAESLCGKGCRIADLTGGLGSDSHAFSKTAAEVWYNEADATLCAAAGRNFARLGALNISTNCFTVSSSTEDWKEALKAFGPDLIYLDPARRDSAGRKVFLLEDCSPDVASLLPALLEIAPLVMVKLSPMADISMVCRRLGGHVSEVHIAGTSGECKELVCVADRGTCDIPLCVVESEGSEVLRFTMEEEAKAKAAYLPDETSVSSFSTLLEPTPALMKSGCRKLLCSRFGLTRAGKGTNLYLAPEGMEVPAALFKSYRISSAMPFGKDSFRKLSAMELHADVTARNLPVSSEELARRTGVRPGQGGSHIFGCTLDYIGTETAAEQRMIFITSQINTKTQDNI